MFTFPLSAVRAIIARGELDAAANGGFRNPHFGLAPGKDEKPGLWLVGHQGVYAASNGKLPEGGEPMVCYADECNPGSNADWWGYKRRHFGGDNGIEFLAAEEILAIADTRPSATHLRIELDENSIGITVLTR
ncbi:DUF3085 domain-containing protein [Mesorhizobium sp. 113-3-3]|uniref:DUF3085 domain-containing protein n=1 Tax=Mesorhizobium sp. 113-3-3 TaxID=2744516 RepID=UPI0018EE2396|nr:DUF3085 domain-containing protein [Mesorhizobium sp. 113-3-3]BCG83542.1 hypothetical protein MesoLj113b_70840 [Mesorhizobium sp. 113-3-3]